MSKNFINFHVLISHSPSCLNRDDMNMQKTAVFGGSRRVRISSQSLKRSFRTGNYYKVNLGEMSIRTINLSKLREVVAEELANKYDRDLVIETLSILSGKEVGKDEGEEAGKDKKVENDSVAPWAIEEIAWFCERVKEAKEAGKDVKKMGKELKQDISAMRQALNQGLDIALFGRMATSGLMSEIGKIDGALAVAHALTTHEVDSDLDWFTAVDDLQEQGAGHLDTQEFSSGVFYRYASLNISQLQENLGGAGREKVLDIAAHVIHMLATEVPSAKQQSFAAFNVADMVVLSLSDQPISLANAFEKAIWGKKEGLLVPSVKAFHGYWEKIYKGYGFEDKSAEFLTLDLDCPAEISKKQTLKDLENWLRSDGE